MPRSTQDILDHADGIAKRFEDYEPSTDDEVDVAAYLLRRAALARARSERQVAEAVDSARRAGMSWKRIGAELGISAQGAQQRYGASPNPRSGPRASHGFVPGRALPWIRRIGTSENCPGACQPIRLGGSGGNAPASARGGQAATFAGPGSCNLEEPSQRVADDLARGGVVGVGSSLDRGAQFKVDAYRHDLGSSSAHGRASATAALQSFHVEVSTRHLVGNPADVCIGEFPARRGPVAPWCCSSVVLTSREQVIEGGSQRHRVDHAASSRRTRAR